MLDDGARCSLDVDQIQASLGSVGWIWPAYIQNQIVEAFAHKIFVASPANKQQIFAEELPTLYPNEWLARMLLERYRITPVIQEFASSIGDAIKAFQLGLYHAAVCTFLPILEGVLRLSARTDERVLDPKSGGLVTQINAFLAEQQGEANSLKERKRMLRVFKKWLIVLNRRYDYEKSPSHLNRNAVLHGLSTEYGDERNFYILISVLDLLTFVLGLRSGGTLTLAPRRTAESVKLTQYYCMLQGLATVHPLRRRNA